VVLRRQGVLRPDPNGKGYLLIFQVKEMPVLRVVEFRGRSKVSLKELEEFTGLKAGARADHVRTGAAVARSASSTRTRGTSWPRSS
jgi:outer membrane protein assembly factor BamA